MRSAAAACRCPCATMPGWGSWRSKAERAWCPAGWFAESTRAHADIGVPGRGYGYQWWTYPEGRFGAQGIFGQTIRVDPKSKTVIVVSAAAAQGDRPRLRRWRADRRSSTNCSRRRWPNNCRHPGEVEGYSTRSKCPGSNPATASATIRSATASGGLTSPDPRPGTRARASSSGSRPDRPRRRARR